MKKSLLSLMIIASLSGACIDTNPNLNTQGQDVLEALLHVPKRPLAYYDTVYVPIYSDIYSETKEVRFLLTATLSIRNTSQRDSLFIEDIDYYDSKGKLVRQYLEQPLVLLPLQSVEYVIDEKDQSGGAGANFLVNWGASTPQLKPLFQGVMISTNGQQGISFLTEGISISQRAASSDSLP